MRMPVAGLAALILSSATVSAGDMPASPYMPDPNLQPVHDWTGGYVGLHGGYGWGNATATATPSTGGGGGTGGVLGGLLGGDGLLGDLLGLGGGGGGGGGVGGLLGDIDDLLGNILFGGGGGGGVLDPLLPATLDTLDELLGGILGSPDFGTSADFALRGSGGSEMEGFIGGGQIGYNWQSGPLVVGLESDLAATGLKSESGFELSENLAGLDLGGGTTVDVGELNMSGGVETDLNWLGTIRGRVGFAMDRVLVFGTGGVAFGDVDVAAYLNSTLDLADVDVGGTPVLNLPLFSTSVTGSSSELMVGYTLGAGVEYAFSDTFSGKLEYAYVNLGETSVALSDGSKMDVEVDMHLVKAGANVRF